MSMLRQLHGSCASGLNIIPPAGSRTRSPRIKLALPQLNKSPGSVSVGTISDLHSHLGNAGMVRGDLALAAADYKAALRLAPHLVSCWCNLGNAHHRAGSPQDSVAYYLQALKLNPGHWPSRTNLVQALMATKQYIIARGLLLELVSERPQDGALCHQLGKVRFDIDEPEAAIVRFEQAIVLNPRDAESLYWIGGIKQRAGQIDAAKAAYAEAARIQPLIRRPAAKVPADFRVLALYGPFAGNTPTNTSSRTLSMTPIRFRCSPPTNMTSQL